MALCGRNCEECLYNNECGGCTLCEASLCEKNCSSCFALCFERSGVDPILKDLDTSIKANEYIDLPYHIPVVPDVLKNMIPKGLSMTIAVHAGNMFSRRGEHIFRKYLEQGYQGALNVHKDTEAVLEFYVKDKTLEGFWDKRRDIYKDLKKLNFRSIIAPNFSVYEDAPRIDHIYSIRRSKTVYNELLDSGINSIPDVSWYNRRDLDEWAKEITLQNIKLIAFSFQTVDVKLKTANVWRCNLLGFRYLCQNIPKDVSIIVAGVVSPFRVYEVISAAAGRRIHVLNQSAYVQSRRGMLSETRIPCPRLSFDEIFYKNLIYFNELYDAMNTSTLVGDLLNESNEKIREYALTPDRDLFNDRLSNSLIERIVRKRKIKLVKGEVSNTCQNQGEAAQSQQPAAAHPDLIPGAAV